LERGDARPLAVDRKITAAGQTQRVLDALVAEGDVDLDEVGRELCERPLQDVLAGGAARARACDHRLEPLDAIGGLFHLPRAALLERLHLGQRALRLAPFAADPLR